MFAYRVLWGAGGESMFAINLKFKTSNPILGSFAFHDVTPKGVLSPEKCESGTTREGP